jgi:hypothetical protein
MNIDRDRYLLLSRAGRTAPSGVRPAWRGPPSRRGLAPQRERWRALARAVTRRGTGRIDIQAYLQLEFAVDELVSPDGRGASSPDA